MRTETLQGDRFPVIGADPLEFPRVVRCFRLSEPGPPKPIAELSDFALDSRGRELAADGTVLVEGGFGCKLDAAMRRPLLDEKKRPREMHRSIRAYDPRSGAELWALEPMADLTCEVFFRLDSTAKRLELQYLQNGRLVRELRTSRDGKPLPPLPTGIVDLGPDARIWTDSRVTLVQQGSSKVLVTLDPDDIRSSLPNGFSRDGRLITFGTRDGTVLVFDLDAV